MAGDIQVRIGNNKPRLVTHFTKFLINGEELVPVDCQRLVTSSHNSKVSELGQKLLKAASDGNVQETKSLLVKGALFTADWLGVSPLHLAARNNHREVCEILLNAGISKDARTKVDKTALHLAAFHGHAEVVELLLENQADADCRDMLGMTPLHWAAQNGHAEVVRLLKDYWAETNPYNKFELTPFDLAQHIDRQDIAEMIVTNNINTGQGIPANIPTIETDQFLNLQFISDENPHGNVNEHNTGAADMYPEVGYVKEEILSQGVTSPAAICADGNEQILTFQTMEQHFNNASTSNSPIPLETILMEGSCDNSLDSGTLHLNYSTTEGADLDQDSNGHHDYRQTTTATLITDDVMEDQQDDNSEQLLGDSVAGIPSDITAAASYEESLNFLQAHGITLLPNDDTNSIFTTVLESGHSVVLTEVGKEMLDASKRADNQEAHRLFGKTNASPMVTVPTATTKPTVTTTKKIVTANGSNDFATNGCSNNIDEFTTTKLTVVSTNGTRTQKVAKLQNIKNNNSSRNKINNSANNSVKSTKILNSNTKLSKVVGIATASNNSIINGGNSSRPNILKQVNCISQNKNNGRAGVTMSSSSSSPLVVRKRIVMKKNKLSPMSTVNMVVNKTYGNHSNGNNNKVAVIATKNNNVHNNANNVASSSSNSSSSSNAAHGIIDLETVMCELIDARKTIEEYKVKLFQKEQENLRYKHQLKQLMNIQS